MSTHSKGKGKGNIIFKSSRVFLSFSSRLSGRKRKRVKEERGKPRSDDRGAAAAAAAGGGGRLKGRKR